MQEPLATAKRPRRWLRFSLRTLLLLTAVVACWLGVQVNKAQKQRAAVAAIEYLGGKVVYARAASDGHRFNKYLARLIGRDYVDEVQVIVIENLEVVDADLAPLADLSSLKFLYLNNLSITDSGLEHLRNLHQLHWLSLENLNVTDAALQHLTDIRSLQALLEPVQKDHLASRLTIR